MIVNTHHAKSQLSRLIAAAEAGEDVVIARNGRPVVRLLPVRPAFEFDRLKHLVSSVPDFEEKMPEAELALWDGES